MARKIIALFLLILFAAGSTPDQLYHLLARHHDTVDAANAPISVANEHIHCAALQYELHVFDMSQPVKEPGAPAMYVSISSSYSFLYCADNTASNSGRAPPAQV